MRSIFLLALCTGCSAAPARPAPAAEVLVSTAVPVVAPVVSAVASEPPPAELVIPEPPTPGGFAGGAGNVPEGVTGVWAFGQRAIAVGNGFLYRSNDAGHTFARATIEAHFPVVWGPSADEIYVGGEGALQHSVDGGVTFTRCAPAPGVVQSIWGRSPSEIYVVGGSTPYAARSTDHCASWSKLPVPLANGWLYDVTTTGTDLVVVGADDGAGHTAFLARSADAGATWKRLTSIGRKVGEPDGSRKVCFASGTLFAASSYSLYASRDLGKSWRLATDVGTEVLALACHGQDVIVGGRNRALFVSRDLGATWTNETLPDAFKAPSFVSVQSAFISDAGDAYLGIESYGQGGTVLRRAH